MMRTNFICLFIALTSLAFAQKPVMEFETTKHDFGKIEETDGKVTHTFEFTNTGAAPLIISNVRASCGCTTPNWTKEPVEPGQKGKITATYNPVGRPGGFNKTITITANTEPETTRLTISGTVNPKPKQVVDNYPVKAGQLGMNRRVVNLGNINHGDSRTGEIKVSNLGDKDITVAIKFADKRVADIEALTLKPKQEGALKLIYSATDDKDWGQFNIKGRIIIDGQENAGDDYQVIASGNVVEDFSKMSEDEKRNAPILELSGKSVNLGTMKKGTAKVAKFRITNQGAKNPLLVRRVVSYTDNITPKATKTSLAPGKKGDINVLIDTKDLEAKDYKRTCVLLTNDPNQSNTVLTITFTVED